MKKVINSYELHEMCQKAWSDYHEKEKRFKKIEVLLGYMDVNDLDDVINYIGIIMRKKEAEGKFDYLKK